MKLSIIIPVYNVENHICKCVESCLNQTYQDYEVICVDDGSTDKSKKYLDLFQDNPKVQIIHKKNGGVSSARNVGLSLATGDWIWFVDSDDTIEPDCIKRMYGLIQENDTLLRFEMTGNRNSSEEVKNIDGVHQFEVESERLWLYWFRLDVIKENEITFDESMKYNEDVIFITQYKLFSNRMLKCGFKSYNYNYRTDSAMSSINQGKRAEALFRTIEIYRLLIRNLEREEFKEYLQRCQDSSTAMLLLILLKYYNFRTAQKVFLRLKKIGAYPYKITNNKYSRNYKENIVKLIYGLFSYNTVYNCALVLGMIVVKKKYKNFEFS